MAYVIVSSQLLSRISVKESATGVIMLSISFRRIAPVRVSFLVASVKVFSNLTNAPSTSVIMQTNTFGTTKHKVELNNGFTF